MASNYSFPFFGHFSFLLLVLLSCNNTGPTQPARADADKEPETNAKPIAGVRHFRGAFSNGMKGDSIFFDVSPDGKRLENLTFKGYWRCAGRLEQTTAGPDGSFTIESGKIKGHISEPPDGGSTAWRFDLEADITDKTASGNFRMNINNLGCDTYKLEWTAIAE